MKGVLILMLATDDTCISSTSTPTPVLYTIEEAAGILKVCRKTIDRALKSGALQAYYPSHGAARITVKQLEDWLGGAI